MKIVFAIFILAFTLNSEAQLRCFNLFTHVTEPSIEYYADAIDDLNIHYDRFIYTKDLRDSIIPDIADKNLPARTKARWKAYRLRSILKELKSAGSWDRYDFEVFAKRLEKLSFLADPNVTKDMSSNDKILYRQARHSLLAKGLQSFLFDGTNTSPSFKRKIFNWMMVPLKDIYTRWAFALFMMPKLNGAVLPLEIAEKIAWQGLDANRELLRPYLKHSQFKSFFNVFSSTYNWTLFTAIFVGLPTYGTYKYYELKNVGTEKAIVLFTPMLKQSEAMANQNYHEMGIEKDSVNMLQVFRDYTGREPNEAELEMIKKLK